MFSLLWVLLSGGVWAHDGDAIAVKVAVEDTGACEVEFDVAMHWLMGLPKASQLFAGNDGDGGTGVRGLMGHQFPVKLGEQDLWENVEVRYRGIDVAAGEVEPFVVVKLTGQGEGNLEVSLVEDASATLVMTYVRDGKQERRGEVLFPGEVGRGMEVVAVGGAAGVSDGVIERGNGEEVESLGDGEAVAATAAAVVVEEPVEAVVVEEILEERGSFWGELMDYGKLGFVHIIPKGLDHILFVVGLFFLGAGRKALLIQVTLFTVAHALTLGLAAGGWITAPAKLVEIVIALSIAVVGIENTMRPQLGRWRLVLVFVFGLIHGLGVAGMLEEFGLPEGSFLWALAAFNVGVELGHLAVIVVLALLMWPFLKKAWYRKVIAVPVSLMIAGAGLWWAFERAFLGG